MDLEPREALKRANPQHSGVLIQPAVSIAREYKVVHLAGHNTIVWGN